MQFLLVRLGAAADDLQFAVDSLFFEDCDGANRNSQSLGLQQGANQ
jgi:hypothetical protein